jgi:hypothetical protein
LPRLGSWVQIPSPAPIFQTRLGSYQPSNKQLFILRLAGHHLAITAT